MKTLSLKLFRLIIRFLFHLVANVDEVGFEKLPPTGGYVIAANHIGRLDAAMAYFIINRSDIVMVVAEKYQNYSFYRWLVRITDGMFIDRENPDIATIRETLRRLKGGQVLVITPEGTRSKSGNLIEAKSGAGYLAWKAGVPILPVALTGTEDSVVVSRLKRFKCLQIRAVAGDFFVFSPNMAGRHLDELMSLYTEEIMCRIAVLLPPERRGVYANHPRLKELLTQV